MPHFPAKPAHCQVQTVQIQRIRTWGPQKGYFFLLKGKHQIKQSSNSMIYHNSISCHLWFSIPLCRLPLWIHWTDFWTDFCHTKLHRRQRKKRTQELPLAAIQWHGAWSDGAPWHQWSVFCQRRRLNLTRPRVWLRTFYEYLELPIWINQSDM